MTLNITLGLIDQVRALAQGAGREIMKIYATDFSVETKKDSTPVTEADRIAEALIVRTIEDDITDKFPIVAEEAFAAGNAPDVSGTPFWLVDALDGTKEFVKRGGDFTVNIALIENARPVLGVVHAPAVGATYWGSHYGAFAETNGAAARPIECRPAPKDGLVAVVSRSHRTPETDAFLSRIAVKEETITGSSLKFCMVAAGRADIYPRFGRTMEWDTAAGHAVVRFAGGQVTKLDGSDLTYGKPGFENPDFIVRAAAGDAGGSF